MGEEVHQLPSPVRLRTNISPRRVWRLDNWRAVRCLLQLACLSALSGVKKTEERKPICEGYAASFRLARLCKKLDAVTMQKAASSALSVHLQMISQVNFGEKASETQTPFIDELGLAEETETYVPFLVNTAVVCSWHWRIAGEYLKTTDSWKVQAYIAHSCLQLVRSSFKLAA